MRNKNPIITSSVIIEALNILKQKNKIRVKHRKTIKEELEQVGQRLGSNPGGLHVDTETGEKHYVKYYRDPDQAKVEDLTSKIYEHMGIKTLQPKFTNVGNKPAVVTKWNSNLEQMQPEEYDRLNPSQQNDIGKMYHAAILTKNWDIIGLEHDNIMRDKNTGHLHSVDTGGAFHFRAQGAPKEYGPDITEKKSFVSRPGEPSTDVFTSVFQQNPEARQRGLDAVKNMDMDHIRQLFLNSGLSNHNGLYSNFAERRNKLINEG